MKKYRYGICGPFDFEEKAIGGQSVKTREFYYALCEGIGKEHIGILESTGYKKNPAKFLIEMVKLMKECESLVIFPGQKGIRIFAPLCKIFKKPLHTKTYYSVIGGWLAKMVDETPGLQKSLAAFDSILVETNVMKAELAERGITNAVRLTNFKRMKPICECDIRKISSPVRLCYFSRVTRLKGIANAVHVVNRINEHGLRCIFDIYGPITDGYDDEFTALQKEFGKGITYQGKMDPADSVKTISQYDLQLFPTRYRTEGIPGSILDSYFAGVPVVASKWNSFSDLVTEGETGIGFEIDDTDDFYKKLDALLSDEEKMMRMKHSCLKVAENYMPKKVIEDFLQITIG